MKNIYAPTQLNFTKKRDLRLKSKQYQIVDDVLFRISYDSVLLRCPEKYKMEKVLRDLYDGPVGGHFGGDTTRHKILHASYYWLTLFKDAHSYVRRCKICQTAVGRQREPALPLQPINIDQPFEQWDWT